MPIDFNNTEIATVDFNGTDVQKVVMDGVTVWEAGLTLNITSNTNNYNLASHVGSATVITVNIAGGVKIGSTSTSTPAFDIPSSLSGRKITINVGNGAYIVGRGGKGGTGAISYFTPVSSSKRGTNGGTGGTAIRASVPISIYNNGTIGGGGGGGGGGAGSLNASGFYVATGGGGGGGGAGYGTRGTRGQFRSLSGSTIYSQYGVNGSATSGGLGGYNPSSIGIGGTIHRGRGGKGGGLGASGARGYAPPKGSNTSAAMYPGNGGAAGYYADGYSKITWLKTGTRLGRTRN